MCPGGVVTENVRGRYRGRMWEIGRQENTIFFILFQNPPKIPCPYFFTTPPKKGKPFFRQLIGKNYLG